MRWGKEKNKSGPCQGKGDGAEVWMYGCVGAALSGDGDIIGEPDGETGGYDTDVWIREIISFYPYVPRMFFPGTNLLYPVL